MSHTTPLRGPDLALGVPADSVEAGTPFVGHFQGEEVLLIRLQGGVSAIGARCTHYGAPLDAGLLVGDELRCPWHHAGFCVRDGRASRAPALDDLPSYDVSDDNDVITVLGRRSPRANAQPTTSLTIVVVGGGAAAMAAVETLRREGHSGAITLIDSEPDLPVDRPNLSKDFLAGQAPQEWLFPRDQAFYDALQVRRVHGTVTQIRHQEHRVVVAEQELSYDALLLVTGAQPRALKVPGADHPHVFTLRSAADCRAIVATAQGAREAVIIGAGFLGLEAAAALRTRGLAVTVVAP